VPDDFDSKRYGASNEDSVAAIAWVLPRIAEGSYSREEDGLMVWDDSNNIDLMEEVLMDGDPEHQAALNRCKNSCTTDSIREACIAYLGPVLGARIADQITEPAYWRAVVGIHGQQKALASSLQILLIKQREGLSTKTMAKVEAGVIPEALTCGVISTYAKEIARGFPNLIKRAERIRILDADDDAPLAVQTFLGEASQCYIYGHYLASAVLCRAAVEVAIRERLQGTEQGAAESRFLDEHGQNSLENLIKVGKQTLPWDKKKALDGSDEIRRAANKAAHGVPLGDEECIELFIKARGVVRELYSDSPDILHLG
jgi:hypothetical protein